ncbi:MAG: hypothetical protein KGM47_12135 [Acidobacteriota bacterium]|nr:hypothetical protein [Acidobacteriota bacterium]
MAVTRTILPRKGLIQSQHGLTGYEADQDANALLLDSNVAFVSDLLFGDLGINGVVSGFALSTAASLTPGVAAGVLYAQGQRYAPASAPAIPAAPASATSYLFYNSSSGFYWQASPVGATAGDALIGQVVASATAVTAVTQTTKIMGQIALAPGAAGNFTVQHFLGRKPVGASLLLTSTALIVWQAAPWDATNLNLNAAGAATATVMVW